MDRIAAFEQFWPDRLAQWAAGGKMPNGADPYEHVGLDMRCGGWLGTVADPNFKEEIIEETEENKLVRDGNGAVQRLWKHKSGTPEHVDFLVKDRAGWEEPIRPRILDESL